MILLVDTGNSRIKWASWKDNSIQDAGAARYSRDNIKQCLDRYWQSLPVPREVHVACVADAAIVAAIAKWAETHWQLKPQFARVEKQAHGVINSYSEYQRLGIDRWLAMIAGHYKRHNPVCIIDCGTAITIDAVSAGGEHLGGIILPGLNLMRHSLQAVSTAFKEQQELSAESASPDLGQSTTRGVASGCLLAAAGAVSLVQQRLQQKYNGTVEYLITGGDAGIIMPGLTCHPRHEPHLVLRGLAIQAGLGS